MATATGFDAAGRKTFHGMEAGEGTNHKSPSLSTARSLTSESREEEEKQLEPRASGDGD
jgi:hypothetical protein